VHDNAERCAEISSAIRIAEAGADPALRFPIAAAAGVAALEIFVTAFYESKFAQLGAAFRDPAYFVERPRSVSSIAR
jgi:hypothetical protein